MVSISELGYFQKKAMNCAVRNRSHGQLAQVARRKYKRIDLILHYYVTHI